MSVSSTSPSFFAAKTAVESATSKDKSFDFERFEYQAGSDFKNNRYEVLDSSQNEKFDAAIERIEQGDVTAIDETFFPKKSNEETDLVYQIVYDLLNGKQDCVKVEKKSTFGSIKLVYNGKKYSLYDVLKKVKWDLIEFDNKSLSVYKAPSFYSDFKQSIRSKNGLYKRLHSLEVSYIKKYTSYSSINDFLRKSFDDKYDGNKNSILHKLVNVAVLCSGLNKIGESKNIKKSKYLYRCISDDSRDLTLKKRYQRSLENEEKVKEPSFIGVSYKEPLTGFLSSDHGESYLKIYVNAGSVAKDISGLSYFPFEHECLMLPNTKELFLREISYPAKHSPANKAHIFAVKVISKRMQVH